MMMRQIIEGNNDDENNNNNNNNEEEELVMMSSSSITKGNTSSSLSSSASRCQDCGNQAKKGCVYLRCRTCCKSKGFHCQTHVKSTWVPLYRRRQKQLLHQQQQTQHFHNTTHYHHQQMDIVLHNQNSPQGLLLEDRHHNNDNINNKNDFPAEVNETATFRAVRVSSVDDVDGAAQYAYQASVVIGGHVFKGILYDQGGSTSSYCGLVAADHHHLHQPPAAPGLVFHQLPNNDNDNDPIRLITSRDYINNNYYVVDDDDQRPLFVGSASSALQQPGTTANFMSAGMQFFPNPN